MLYGYVRVSTSGQEPERQVRSMRERGVPEGNIVVDVASGKDMEREGLSSLLARLEPGDVLLLDSLDRLGRSYDDVCREWRRITRDMGVDVKCLDLEFFDSAMFKSMGDLGTCVEDMLLSLLSYVAQAEREKMLRRQAEGIAVARERGAYKGRKPVQLTPERRTRAEAVLRESGQRACARELGVDPATVRRMLADGRLAA